MEPLIIQFIITTIISVISVFAAIFIPWRIMQKQNKIAIFDKRFAVYQEIKKIVTFAEPVQNLKELPNNPNPTEEQLSIFLLSGWCQREWETEILWEEFSHTNDANTTMKLFNAIEKRLEKQISLLESSEFLFNKNTFNFVNDLKIRYNDLIVSMERSFITNDASNFCQVKKDFCSFVNERGSEIKTLEKELKL